MRFILTILILLAGHDSYSDERIVIGKSNFNEKDIQSAIIILTSDYPDGSILCSKVDKIYPKILEEKLGKNGKVYSKEKWYISGCNGASSVIAKLYPSGLVGIGKAKH